MKCPFCNAPTRVTHTYIAGDQKTTERRCNGPRRHKLTFVTAFVQEAKRRGEGAAALAEKIRKGIARVNVEIKEESESADQD